MTMLPHQITLANDLATAGHRLTAARRRVADLIGARDGHFTAAELLADARARRLKIGRASVFRTLDLLTELNVLERVDLPTGEHAYVACRPAHHHHVICRVCGQVAEVDDAGLDDVAAEMERRTGFEIDTHRLEPYGRCPACRTERAR
jgi:Fur family transcriptional regulator, ferric uptake regulator